MTDAIRLDGPLLLIGGGKMGGAMLEGWLRRGVAAADVVAVEPGASQAAGLESLGVKVVASADAIPKELEPQVVVVALKPQVIDGVMPQYARFAGAETVFLSIAAGKTIGLFEQYLGAGAAIVRAMPNTPAAIGRGMMVGCANARVDQEQKSLCDSLMAAVGEVAWIEDEALMDAVTGVSGSGPAYVFLMIECLAEAARAAGLPGDLAERLALVTVSGAGELARLSEAPPATLRQNVTSPNGTTQAALEVLMAEDGLSPLMVKAVAAAAKRSRELAG